MPKHKEKRSRSEFLVSAAGFVIVVAGMKAAASLINPFLLALFIATICAPPWSGCIAGNYPISWRL